LLFARYSKGNYVKEEFLFYLPLDTTTTVADIMGEIALFFEVEKIK
jgi:hypothetical protein